MKELIINYGFKEKKDNQYQRGRDNITIWKVSNFATVNIKGVRRTFASIDSLKAFLIKNYGK